MGRISQAFIDDVLGRIDIVEVIGSRIVLRKTGRNYMACCPFHHEKTASMSVVPDKQFYHCFGCGASGSALKFVIEFDRLSFLDALQKLADSVGMALPVREETGAEAHLAALYSILKAAAVYYQQQIALYPGVQAYLQHREIAPEIVVHFGLGYATGAWEQLSAAVSAVMSDMDQITVLKQLEKAGLWIRKQGAGGSQGDEGYDRFRDRLMFPIRDQRGRIIGFGGRVVGQGGDGQPKYLNSPETPLFHKSSELYGLYEVLQHTPKPSYCLIVEGYMDVITLFQHGIPYAVATLGTATSARHLLKLFRYTSEVIYCFDGDAAGQKAAFRGLASALSVLQEGRVVRFLFLPQEHDPDSFMRAVGKQGFETALHQAQSLSDYLFATLEAGCDLKTVEGRVALVKAIKPLLAQVPEGTYRALLKQRLADRCELQADALSSLLGERILPVRSMLTQEAYEGGYYQKNNRTQKLKSRQVVSLWRHAVKMLLNYPQGIAWVEPIEGHAVEKRDPCQAIWNQLCLYLKNQGDQPLVLGRLLDEWSDDATKPLLLALIVEPDVFQDRQSSQAEQALKDVWVRLCDEARDLKMGALSLKVREGGMQALSSEEKQLLQRLLRKTDGLIH
jgi:DNA primase